MLPNIDNNKDDIKDLTKALEEAFEPVVKDILETIKTVRKAFPEVGKKEALVHAVQFAMDSLKESVDKMTEGKGTPTQDEIMGLFSKLKSADEEGRKEILGVLLNNSKLQNALLDAITGEMLKSIDMSLEELVDASHGERRDREEEKRRRADADRDRNRNEANRKAKSNAPKSEGPISKMANAIPDALSDIVKAFQNFGLALGAFGLFSMLPKQVQETFAAFTATFTYIRKIMESGFLKPVLKLLEALPVLGTIIKKLPLLNMIIAAFEIIPKVVKAFSAEGIWKAMEVGLKAVYDYFVGDVLGLVAKFGDWIQEKLFGKVFLDLEGAVKVFSDGIHKWIDDFVAIYKSVFSGDWKGALKGLGTLLADGIDNLVNTVLTAFGLPADFNLAEKAKEIWAAVAGAFSTAKQFIVDAANGVVKFVSDSVSYLIDTVKTKWNAAVDGIMDFGEYMSTLATDMWTSFKTGMSDAWNGAISNISDAGDYVKGIFDSVGKWISDSWAAGVAGVGDLATSITDTVTGIWTSITDKIASVFTSAIESMTELKDMMKKWFENMVKKTANYILDFLPMGIGDGLKYNVEEPPQASAAPTTRMEPAADPNATERRMVTGTQKLEETKLKNYSRGNPPPPAAVKVDNSRVTNSTTYTTNGNVQAAPNSPLRYGAR